MDIDTKIKPPILLEELVEQGEKLGNLTKILIIITIILLIIALIQIYLFLA